MAASLVDFDLMFMAGVRQPATRRVTMLFLQGGIHTMYVKWAISIYTSVRGMLQICYKSLGMRDVTIISPKPSAGHHINKQWTYTINIDDPGCFGVRHSISCSSSSFAVRISKVLCTWMPP